jgi:hypothetical protein
MDGKNSVKKHRNKLWKTLKKEDAQDLGRKINSKILAVFILSTIVCEKILFVVNKGCFLKKYSL